MIKETRWMVQRQARRIGRDISTIPGTLKQWQAFWGQYQAYRKLAPAGRKPNAYTLYPCVEDATSTTPVEPVYFYQDTWAFGLIAKDKPAEHIDIGSSHRFNGFLSQIVPVTMVDIRPLPVTLPGLNFREGSILNLPMADASVHSLSSICVIEHIGLGRYGDDLDPDGSEKSIAEIKRVIAPGGNVYVSVPIEKRERTYFNAHRAFTTEGFLKRFEPFTLKEVRYIVGNDFVEQQPEANCVGCFHFCREDV
ncbi:DUF268 domain-containing protein [Mucisphaera sp.]|uniref:DUF268 domain-containing protein n=1 Tax=Mucisphaera sp. TaxID=2913024 RepID=UPI003D0FF7EC